jgi:hypothetical protein
MVRVLVDYSNGHNEQLSALVERLNATYEGYPILFQVSWNDGRREGLELYIEFEYEGERGFTSLASDVYPTERINCDWLDIKQGVDAELGLQHDESVQAVAFASWSVGLWDRKNSVVWEGHRAAGASAAGANEIFYLVLSDYS